MVEIGARAIGARVLRAEDPRILTGRGRYVDDIVLPGMLHAAFLRSTVPHGRLVSVDVSRRGRSPVSSRSTPAPTWPGSRSRRSAGRRDRHEPDAGAEVGPAVHGLATDKVRYVGDPIALVVAEDRYIAEDALELIDEDIEMLDAGRHLRGRARPGQAAALRRVRRQRRVQPARRARRRRRRRSRRPTGSCEASIEVHRHQPVPMECRGLIADWDAAAEHLTIHTATQSPHMYPDAAAAADQRADGADPRARRRRRRRVRPQERRGPRGRRRRRRVHRPRSAGEVDRGPARAPRLRWAGPRGEGRHRSGRHRRRRAARRADGRQAEPRRLRLRPVPGRDLRRCRSAARSRAPRRSRPSRRTTPRCSATRRRTSRTAGRGRPATSCASACSTSSHASSSIDPLDVRRRNYVAPRRATARDAHRPAVRRCHHPEARRAGRDDRRLGRLPTPPGRRRSPRALPRARHRVVPRGGARAPRSPGRRRAAASSATRSTHVSVERRRHDRPIITRQQPHGQGHETTLAQVAVDELGVRFEDVRVVFGDTDVTPMALVGTGGSRAATMANGAVLHGSRAAAGPGSCRSPPTCSRRAPTTSRSPRA